MPLNMYIALLLIAVFQSTNAGDSKAFTREIAACCQHGYSQARKQANSNCQAIGRSAVGKLPGFICRTAAEMCCVKQLQKDICDSGVSVAMAGGTCNLQPPGKEDHQECCYCCYLGMKATKETMGCRGSSFLGSPCQKAFLKCCSTPNPHPSGIPSVFGPEAQSPTSPTKTCSSLGCSQSCEVTNGIPACTCRNGFSLNSNGRTCDDVNECTRREICGRNEVCRNTYGSYECKQQVNQRVTCPAGLEVDSSGRQCQDVDECQLYSPCKADEECRNTIGSYTCKYKCPSTYVFRNNRCEKACRSGYVWDGTKCADENECKRPGICKSNERCVNDVGSYRCVVERCNTGYTRIGSQCVDNDECAKYGSKRLCGSQTCVNVPGSYRCEKKCNTGYEWINSRCIDIDECRTLSKPCGSNEECQNIAGSYRCKCSQGYKRIGSSCQDIDECSINGLCASDETCINKPGTYRCEKQLSCRPGYRLNRGVCVDVDECAESRRCSADEECINTVGSYQCKVKCSRGYQRVRDDCRDIDECAVLKPCKLDEECRNLPGTFRCAKVQRCPSGYERFNGRCEDKDECINPNICRSPTLRCENIPGSYRCQYRACPQGFERRRNGLCYDINECSRGTHVCKSKAEECVNTNGTYLCRCNPGYIRYGASEHCRDKDECRGPDQYCAHKCVNTQGSFRCECRKGYTLAGGRNCIDVNECRQGRSKCDHDCVNTQGSYYCRCRPGYTLLSDGSTCRDINECNAPQQYGSCVYRCRNTMGSYTCSCPQGYKLTYYRYCSDIDECAQGIDRCGSGCVNTRGGYECLQAVCPQPYHVQRSATHCARKSCALDDVACRRETRKSIRWHGRGLPNNAGVGAFSYMYNITTTGYQVKPVIRFSIKRGNFGNAFQVYSLGYGKSILKNRKVLKGPVHYKLEFVGEVIDLGKVRASFVTYLNVWVGRYDF